MKPEPNVTFPLRPMGLPRRGLCSAQFACLSRTAPKVSLMGFHFAALKPCLFGWGEDNVGDNIVSITR
jgi:hypothetical protein